MWSRAANLVRSLLDAKLERVPTKFTQPLFTSPLRGEVTRTMMALACTGLAICFGPLGSAQGEGEAKTRIAFVGDSTADELWGGVTGLVPREACLKGFELGRFAKNSTGLTRPEKFNWADEVKRIGESFKPQLFVMSLGLNDLQSVVERGKVTLENSPDYPAKYKDRVRAVLKSATANGAALLWIGLPAMRDAASDRNAREKNGFFAEAIAELAVPAVEFAEPWKLARSGEDKFASFGPDQSGKMIQIRASDGQHFTPAGELLVAAYLWPKIVAILAKSGAKLAEACAS